MEASRGFITVMTNQGEFLNVPWSQGALPGVGKEVEFEQPAERKERLWQRPYFAALAASIALILLFIPAMYGLIFTGPMQVIAYINVDINPSLELGINKEGKVVETIGLNDDGKKLLEKVQVSGISVQEAIEKLTAGAIAEKYLEPDKGNNILITVSSDKKLPAQVKELEKEVQKVLQEKNIVAQAATVEVPAVIHNKAREANVSAGKYVVFMEAVEEGLEVSLDDLRENSISNVINQAGGETAVLIQKAQQDKDRIKDMQKKYEQDLREKQQAGQNTNIGWGWGQQSAPERERSPEVRQDGGKNREYNAGNWPPGWNGSVTPAGQQGTQEKKNDEKKSSEKKDQDEKTVRQDQGRNSRWNNQTDQPKAAESKEIRSKETGRQNNTGAWPLNRQGTVQTPVQTPVQTGNPANKSVGKKDEDKKTSQMNQGRNPRLNKEVKSSPQKTEQDKKEDNDKRTSRRIRR